MAPVLGGQLEDAMKRTSLLLIALVVAAPAFAQGMKSAPAPGMVETMRGSFNYVKDFITKSAEQMPEADYAFKATPEVRSFGQIVGHIADANYMFCSTVLGEANPSPGVEKTKTSKADLVAALKASYEYCGRAYAIPDADTGTKFTLFGQEFTRAGGLMINTTHNWEHYGNIVTYLRLKGQVPPSSKQM
jgi:uncharacterized damage-inducible protein DinB